MKKIISHLFLILVCCLHTTFSNAEGHAIEENMKPSIKISTLVLMGASYVQGWPLKLKGFNIINKGIDGEESHQILARFQKDVIELNPDYVLIWGFINDIHRNPKDKIDFVLERAKSSTIKMIELARRNGIKPILATEMTILPEDTWEEKIMGLIGKLRNKRSYQDFVNNNVMQINKWLINYAKENNILFIDISKLLADENGIRLQKYTSHDGTHITAAAYAALTEAMRDHLK